MRKSLLEFCSFAQTIILIPKKGVISEGFIPLSSSKASLPLSQSPSESMSRRRLALWAGAAVRQGRLKDSPLESLPASRFLPGVPFLAGCLPSQESLPVNPGGQM